MPLLNEYSHPHSSYWWRLSPPYLFECYLSNIATWLIWPFLYLECIFTQLHTSQVYNKACHKSLPLTYSHWIMIVFRHMLIFALWNPQILKLILILSTCYLPSMQFTNKMNAGESPFPFQRRNVCLCKLAICQIFSDHFHEKHYKQW